MIWRYYIKILRYEQFLVPAALMAICLLMMVLLPTAAPSIALGFMEAALPLATAIIATGLFLNDPFLELQYTMSRPMWRTLLERMASLIAVMLPFYILFSLLTRLLGVSLIGWGATASVFLVWIIPTIAWLGIIFFIGTLIRNNIAGNGLGALLWMGCFMLHAALMGSPLGRAVYPFMTIMEPTSTDWSLNRVVLLSIGMIGVGISLLMLRKSELYFRAEA